jgi:hypothetical protein
MAEPPRRAGGVLGRRKRALARAMAGALDRAGRAVGGVLGRNLSGVGLEAARRPDPPRSRPPPGAAVPVCSPPLQAGSGAHLADLPPPLPARSAARYTPATVTTRPLGGHQAYEAGGREARNML